MEVRGVNECCIKQCVCIMSWLPPSGDRGQVYTVYIYMKEIKKIINLYKCFLVKIVHITMELLYR